MSEHEPLSKDLFFRLPRELRDMIYDWVFRNTRYNMHAIALGLRFSIFYNSQYDLTSPSPHWLLTCKQILSEATEQFLRHAYCGDACYIPNPGTPRALMRRSVCKSLASSPTNLVPSHRLPWPLPFPTPSLRRRRLLEPETLSLDISKSLLSPFQIRRLRLTDISLRVVALGSESNPLTPDFPPRISFKHKSFLPISVLQSACSCLEAIELVLKPQFCFYWYSWSHLPSLSVLLALPRPRPRPLPSASAAASSTAVSHLSSVSWAGGDEEADEDGWEVDTSWLDAFQQNRHLKQVTLVYQEDQDGLLLDGLSSMPIPDSDEDEEQEQEQEQDFGAPMSLVTRQGRDGARNEWLLKALQVVEDGFVRAAGKVVGKGVRKVHMERWKQRDEENFWGYEEGWRVCRVWVADGESR